MQIVHSVVRPAWRLEPLTRDRPQPPAAVTADDQGTALVDQRRHFGDGTCRVKNFAHCENRGSCWNDSVTVSLETGFAHAFSAAGPPPTAANGPPALARSAR
jgi:hypothetical protein